MPPRTTPPGSVHSCGSPAAAGLRRGELLGLDWARVDLDGAELLVDRAVVLAGGKPVVRPPKAGQTRTVALDDRTVAMLADWRTRKARTARLNRADGWVWSSDPGGVAWMLPGTLSQRWERIRDAAGLPHVRLHHLRHAHVSILLDAGLPLEAVAERVGHLSTSTTRQYAHAAPGRDRDAAAAIGSILA